MIGPKGNSKFCLPETLNVSRDEGEELILGTLSNRRRRPDDGNRKRDNSFETSLRMYNTLWPDVAPFYDPSGLQQESRALGATILK